MLRTILGIVMMLGLLMSGAVAGGEKKEEKKKGHHEKGKVTAKTDDSVTVEFTHKGKEHKRVIKLEDKMDLISESGKDVPIAEFLKGIEIGLHPGRHIIPRNPKAGIGQGPHQIEDQ